jgi:hypothetical protein
MTRTTRIHLLKGLVFVSCLAAIPVRAGIKIELRFPTPEFIATTAPVYYQGHAAYWYGDRWYYRDGGNWRAYDDEPHELRDYREHHDRQRYYYGRQRWDRDREDQHAHDRDHDRDRDRRDR